jgi:cation-transporting ATPase I
VGGNLGEIGFTVVSGLISGLPPLNARQLLVVNLLTDTLPALAVALRPPVGLTPEALLASGPDRSLGDALIEDAVTRAIITATATTLAWGSARLFGTPARAGTVALVALTGAQLGQTLAVGGRRGPVLVAGVGSLIALAVVVQTPGVSTFFGCTPLGPLGWAQGAGAAVAATGAALIAPTVRTRFRRRREKSAPSGT